MGYKFSNSNKKGSTLKWNISELDKDELEWEKLREMKKEDKKLKELTFYGFMIYKTKKGMCIALQTDPCTMVQIPSRYIDDMKAWPAEAIAEMIDVGVTITNIELVEYNGVETVKFDFVDNED
jgi:hypothetical protein